MHYCIQLQRNNAIIWSAIVPAVPAIGLIGNSHNGQLLAPSHSEIFSRLPTRYRKAFNRAHWLQHKHIYHPLICELSSNKGTHMGTLFALPQF